MKTREKKGYYSSFILILITSALFGQTQEELDKIVNNSAIKILQESEIKALSIGIIDSGKTYIYHFGDIGNGKKPSNSSYYEIASITKTFTGLLLAQAVQDKKLNLDDDIRKFLEGNYPNLEYKGKPVTFRNLATHMSGLPYTFPNKPEIFVNPDYDKLPFIIDSLERNYTKQDFFKDLHSVKIDTIPGYKFNYSNVGANLTAYILENIYSLSYQELLSKYIFKPSDMNNTKLVISEKELPDLVKGYNTKRVEMPFFSQSIRAAGGLKSTMPDMMKYVAFQLNEINSVIKTSHEQIWKQENGTFSAGFNWQMVYDNGERKIFQNGGSFGTSGWIEFYPDSKIGFFIVTNVSGPNIHNKLSQFTDSLYKQIKNNK